MRTVRHDACVGAGLTFTPTALAAASNVSFLTSPQASLTVSMVRLMPDRLDPELATAFRAETRRFMARRVPLGITFALTLAAVAGALERAYFPSRWAAL